MMRYLKLFLLIVFVQVSFAQQTYDDWVSRSFDMLEADSLIQAEDALVNALRLEPANPQNFMLLTNLGTIQRQLGKLDDALLAYSSALMIIPRSEGLLSSRAALYAEMQRWEEAEKDYTQILLEEAENEEALYLRGLVRLQQGDTLAARKDFEWILTFNKTSSKARLGIATLLKAARNYAMAAEMYSQVIHANEESAQLYLKRSEVYYLDGKLSKAVDDINESIRLDPTDPMAYIVRGRIRYAQYDKKSALVDFKKAQSLGFNEHLLQEWIKKCE